MTMRGRPKLTMTKLRRKMLIELGTCIEKGERITMAELARRCRIYDYREARRVLKDLRAMGRAV